MVGAYLSLAAPVMVKAIGWILLLGPNKGVINEWLRALFATEGVPIPLFTLTGMTAARRRPVDADRLPVDAAGAQRHGPRARRGRLDGGRDAAADASSA